MIVNAAAVDRSDRGVGRNGPKSRRDEKVKPSGDEGDPSAVCLEVFDGLSVLARYALVTAQSRTVKVGTEENSVKFFHAYLPYCQNLRKV